MAVNRLLFDSVSALALLLVGIGGAFIPKYVMNRNSSKGVQKNAILQIGNMFAAGVMIAAAFCHLLADGLEELEFDIDFPLGLFLAGFGYLLTLAIDLVAQRGENYGLPLSNDGSSATEPLTDPLPSKLSLRMTYATAVIMAVALSFHSVMEGIAMGAQETVVMSAKIFLAIVVHKGLVGYALGASLVDSQASHKRFWIVAWAFALASPIGIMLGYLLSHIVSGAVIASLTCIAAGTFIYVAMNELIAHEMSKPEHALLKIVFLFTGYGLMALLAVWA